MTVLFSIILHGTVLSITASLVLARSTVCFDQEQSLDLFKVPECQLQGLTELEHTSMPGDCEMRASDINFHVEDVKAGIINVEFKMNPAHCNYTYYKVALSINENQTNKSCNQNGNKLSHSERRLLIHYKTDNSSLRSCKQKENVKFNNVYTGCYSLKISAFTPISRKVGKPKYNMMIKTEYKKSLLIDKKPSINLRGNFSCEGNALKFSIKKLRELNVTNLQVQYRRCEDSSCKCGHCTLGHKWEIEIDWNKSGGAVCGKSVVNADIKCELIPNEGIECTVRNLSAGFYCVIARFLDDRCNQDTVWNRKGSSCSYHTGLKNIAGGILCTGDAAPTSASASMVPVVLGVVVAFVVLISICLVIFIYRKRTLQPFTKPYQYSEADVKRPELLLLYPHDCKEFMDLMKSFRILLEDCTKCEVFDCFDERHAESIGKNKVGWIRRHLMNTERKVVVIESQCAVFHQEALMNNGIVTYSEPHWLDDLFTYALKALTEDMTNNTYEKVFVVRIGGFSDDKDVLNYLSPFARYVMPQHLKYLISQLLQYQNEHCVVLNNGIDRKLEEKIEILARYKANNPEYLSHFIETNIF